MIETVSMVAAIALPLWNIPLIMRMIKRKSSKDISMAWAFGVWVCLILMFPCAIKSPDKIWKIFSIINMILFTFVVFFTVFFRKKG